MMERIKRGFTSEPDPKYNIVDWRDQRLKVAAYVRVSTDSRDQENSLKNQRARYERLIPSNPLWEYAGIYQDEGISGTSMRNRKGLRALIEDCKIGKVDLIVVKEVSRLARNTRDCLDIVQQLAALSSPVGIFFENNNLNTLETGSKIFLTVLAMCAELESELKSRSVDFGLKELYRKYVFPVPTLLGYKKAEKYTMVIEPEGAKTVKLIYALFLAGISPAEIADVLTGLNRPTARNNLIWSTGSVIRILANEKYTGAYLIQKQYTVSFLTHQNRKNKGQKRIYHDPEHHEPIISLEEHIRALLLLRANHDSPFFNNKYEIKVIRKGLFAGFIPLNAAFGGYDAQHYLAAYIMARVPEPEFTMDIPIIPGVRCINRTKSHTASLHLNPTKMKFNRVCVSLLSAEYVELLLNPRERLLAVRKAKSSNKNAIPWNTSSIPSKELNGILYELMGWQKDWQLRIPASILRRGDERVFMFDLSDCEYKFRSDEKKSIHAVPNAWFAGVGEVDYMLRSRRAYAHYLTDWRITASATRVDGFNTYIKPKTQEAIASMIQELMKHGESK